MKIIHEATVMADDADARSPAAIAWPDAARRAAFERWAGAVAPRHGLDLGTLAPASGDASFRRYLRVAGEQASYIVMDAPPPLEDARPFVEVAALAAAAGLHVPRVLEADLAQGFLLLSDLGTESYLDALQRATPAEADRLMRDAIAALVRWQTGVPAAALPPMDATVLQGEIDLFADWCVARRFGIRWSDGQRALWQHASGLLVAHAAAQPQVAVHADWMPRNLMHSDPNPGILDFQDAMRGPLAHDIASLLRDAFVSWDEEREIDWAVRWWDAARRAGLPVAADFGAQWQAIEWTGLLRHLRVMGIFSRLEQRDGKPGYARDLPRFFGYATKVALRYRPLAALLPLLEPMSGAALQAGFTF
jgi:aminoglycoside/choline kinase family phosphotransferase